MNVTNRSVFFIGAVLSLVLSGVAAPLAVRAEVGSLDVPMQSFVDAGGRSSEYIIGKCNAAGFTDVYYVAFEHGLYEIKARNPDRQYVEIKLDPKTGELLKDAETGKIRYKTITRADPIGTPLAWEGIISQIKKEGYREVYSIHYDHQLYEVHARDDQNRVFELFVNPNTGKLLRHPTTGKPLSERVDK
ncbi:MAG: PepSY domain-containing protein [Gammaproteobacteria bacterium]|nr:PepSY domain-containing protein [Gammaproteobacteria bacterium]